MLRLQRTSSSSSSSSFTPADLVIAIALVLVTGATPSAAQFFKNDFSAYPAGTQSCLYSASDSSGCTGATAAEMNACMCTNGGDFVTNSARCIAAQDPADMKSSYAVMQSSCAFSDTALTFSLSQWMAQASGVTPSTSANTATVTATTTASASTSASPTSESSDGDNDDKTGLSSGAKIAIIAASSAVGLALVLAAIFFIVRHRRRRVTYEEVHSMVGSPRNDHDGHEPGAYPSHDHGHMSYGPSELESTSSMMMMMMMDTPVVRKSWRSSSDGAPTAPWSPDAFESVKTNAQFRTSYQQPPLEEVYEMPAEHTHTSLAPPPVEIPTIAFTSPRECPTSYYSELDHTPAAGAPEQSLRYEPFRPR